MDPVKGNHRLFIEHLPDAFAYHQLITDNEGTPVDYIFLDVNRAFETMTGLTRDKIISKKVTEILPEIVQSSFDWIGTYGKVALTGNPTCFDNYSEPLDRWYEVSAYSDRHSFFATVFRDITFLKKEKEALETLVQFTQQNLRQPVGKLDYHSMADKLRQLSGAKFAAFNTYETAGKKIVIRAISGLAESIQRASEMLGFELIGKVWDTIPAKTEFIKGGRLIRYDNLYAAFAGFVPKRDCHVLQKIFGLGEVHIIELAHEGEPFGDFIMLMPRGEGIKNPAVVELYASQAGTMLLRSRGEKELQKSREKTATALNLVTGILESSDNMVIFALDREYRYLAFNENHRKTMKQIWGVEIETGNSMLDYITDPFDREKAKVNFDRALGKEAFTIIEEYGNTEFERRWYEDTYNPLYDAEGKVIGLTLFLSDITERRLTEQALQEYKSRLAQAQSFAKAGAWEYNIETASLYWSKECAELFGLAEGEFEGTFDAFLKRVHPEDREYVIEMNRPILESKEGLSLEYEHRIIKSDGTTCWVRESAGVVYDEPGKPVKIIGFVMDISEQKQIEAEKAHIKVLHAIEEERMRLARELHDETGMALTTVKLDLQMLRKMLAAAGEQHQLRENLLASIARVEDLTKRIRSKSAFLRSPPLDDLGLIAVLKNMVEEINRHSGISAELMVYGAESPLSRSVETVLYRCIQESLTNVVRHARAANVRVHLAWTSQEVTCRIKDDGKGFDPETEAGSKEKMGLKGMQERVLLLQGRIKINSAPQKGTEINITLPL